MWRRIIVLTLGLALLGAGIAIGQLATASLSGVVADSSGAPIPGVELKATHIETNRDFRVSTGESGGYTLLTLPTGRYKITVALKGFKTLEREAELTVNQAANLNLTMQVGNVSEVVNVTTEAPLINATNSTVGTLIDSRQVLDLPLNGRNFTQLILLTPGAAPVDVAQGGSSGPAVQGQRNRSNLYLADGALNSNLDRSQISVSPPLDSIQEFRVESVNNDAEFGGASGAYVNLSTKAGGNRFHGTGYDFLRNDVLNARNTFQPAVPKFRNNIYGFSLGGPIRVPKVYNGKNHTWFFLSYEGVKNRASASSITRVATDAERQGDFSGVIPGVAASNTPIYDPFSTRAEPEPAKSPLPQLVQRVLRDYRIAGNLSITATGTLPLRDMRKASYDADVALGSATAAIPRARLVLGVEPHSQPLHTSECPVRFQPQPE